MSSSVIQRVYSYIYIYIYTQALPSIAHTTPPPPPPKRKYDNEQFLCWCSILHMTLQYYIVTLHHTSSKAEEEKKLISYSIEIKTLEIYKLEVDDATHVIGKHFKSFTDPGSSTTTPASTRTVSPTLTDFRYQARHPIIRHTIYLVVNPRSKIFSHYLVTIRQTSNLQPSSQVSQSQPVQQPQLRSSTMPGMSVATPRRQQSSLRPQSGL